MVEEGPVGIQGDRPGLLAVDPSEYLLVRVALQVWDDDVVFMGEERVGRGDEEGAELGCSTMQCVPMYVCKCIQLELQRNNDFCLSNSCFLNN